MVCYTFIVQETQPYDYHMITSHTIFRILLNFLLLYGEITALSVELTYNLKMYFIHTRYAHTVSQFR